MAEREEGDRQGEDDDAALARYAERAVAQSADLAATIGAIPDDELREQLVAFAVPFLSDVVMLSIGASRLLGVSGPWCARASSILEAQRSSR